MNAGATPNTPRAGGWAGAFVVAWAVSVAVPAAALSGALWLGPSLVRATMRGAYVSWRNMGEGPDVSEPFRESTLAATTATLESATFALLPWSAAVCALALFLLVAGVRLVSGSHTARRAARVALAGLVVCALGGAIAGALGPVAEADRWIGAVRDVIGALRLDVGRSDVDRFASAAVLSRVVWTLAGLTCAGSGLLFAVTGRESVRRWCTERARLVAPSAQAM